MGVEIPASESLESPKAENEIVWKKTTDQTGAVYSGKNTFKSGEGEFTVVHQGDSFPKAHSYLLLTDVPGASANSGATITSKDSSGNQAFVATETRGTTEQEVAVGAGSELKTLLTNSGVSDFPQLPETANRKLIPGRISSEGKKLLGAGFTCERTTVGKYTIKLSAELASEGVITVSLANGAGFVGYATVASQGKKEFKVETWSPATAAGDYAFNFQIMG